MNRQQKRAAEAQEAAVRKVLRDKVTARARANQRLQLVAERNDAISADLDQRTPHERAQLGVQPENIRCSAGCAACCDQLLIVHDVEARTLIARYPERIAQILPELPERDQHLLALAEQMNIPIEVMGLLDACSPEQRAQRYALQTAWFAQRIPCVFLDKYKRCTVYDHRPNVCREHILVSEDPKVCDDRSDKPAPRGRHPLTPAFLESGLAQCKISEDLQLPVRMGLLTTLLMQVLCEESMI